MTKDETNTNRGEEIARQNALRAEHAKRMAEEQQDLLADLRSRGIEVRGVWDLVNMDTAKYREALPVLIEHLGERRGHYSSTFVIGGMVKLETCLGMRWSGWRWQTRPRL